MSAALIRAGMVAALALLAGGCKTASALLLPGEGTDPVGALVVLNKDGSETTLDEANSAARLGSGKASVKRNVAVKPAYQELINGLPMPPKTFAMTFPTNSDTIGAEAAQVVDDIRTEIAQRPGAEVQVTGHTDTVGSDDDNDRLSQERAQSVVSQLIGLGFSKDQLVAVGRGERDAKTDDNVASETERRVDVIVR